MTFEEAALGEPLACCINAQEKVIVSPGDTVLIFGGGTLGLLHAMLARIKGAGPIIVAEPIKLRREAALRLAADYALNPLSDDFSRHIMEITRDAGADVAIFATSDVGLDQGTLPLLAEGARVSVFSGTASHVSFQIDPHLVHYRELQISGTYGCSLRNNMEAISMLSKRQMPFRELISCAVSLNDIGKLMKSDKRDIIFKAVITKFD
jgi:L-iditol 2-dehydrogenase